jgi:Nucleotidyl transferase AbiEii toxin, Type IV TA system
MNRPLPTNLQHFNRLLTEYEKHERGMTVRRARHAIGVVVICAMVDRVRDSDGAHLFVAKGGSAMQLRLGLSARATTDLDFLFRGSALSWLDHFDAALHEGPWNGFDARRKGEPEEIQVPGMQYKPQRFDVQLQYKGKAFSTIQIELALDGLAGADMVDGIDLGFFGLEVPAIPCMSIPLQMAQKLHACTDPYEGEGRENDRTRDLVDLWLLEALLPADSLVDVRVAAVETFARRAKHDWPPVPTITETWRTDYPKLAAEVVGAPRTVEDAAKYVTDLIRRIEALP